MNQPKLSVIIPAYNEEDYLPACLDSVMQNIAGMALEIIVVDNNSTDGTRQVVERYAGGAAALYHHLVDRHLRLERAAGGDEGFHQSARQVERTALTELVAGLQVESADHRAGRAGLGHRVGEPGAEQRHLEEKEQLHMLVLE